MVLCSTATDFRVSAGSETAGQLAANVELDVGLTHEKSLGIGVDCNKLDAAEACIDHAVQRVNATATNANDLDDCQIVLV